MTAGTRRVRFVARVRPYNAGEVASFADGVAARLVKDRLAVYDDADDEDPASEPAMQSARRKKRPAGETRP